MLLVPTAAEELPAVSRLKRTVRELGVQMFIPDPPAIDMTNDKLGTANKLRSLGLASPLTVFRREVNSLSEAGKLLGYPLLAKPRVGHGGRGVAVFRDPEEAGHELRFDIVLQEFMPGEECGVNLFAYPAGYVRSVAVLQKMAMMEGLAGKALHVRRVIRRDVAELAIVATRKLHLEGPIDMDIRRDRDGLPRILDINARAGANILSTVEVLESMLTTAMESVAYGGRHFHASDDDRARSASIS
jgi:carbamoyl-phosphate synthase large subunit